MTSINPTATAGSNVPNSLETLVENVQEDSGLTPYEKETSLLWAKPDDKADIFTAEGSLIRRLLDTPSSRWRSFESTQTAAMAIQFQSQTIQEARSLEYGVRSPFRPSRSRVRLADSLRTATSFPPRGWCTDEFHDSRVQSDQPHQGRADHPRQPSERGRHPRQTDGRSPEGNKT